MNTPGVFPLAVGRERIQPVCRGHLPAAAHLLHRGALLGFHRRLSALPPVARPAAPRPATSPGIAGGQPGIGANYWPLSLPGSPSDVMEPTAINVLPSGDYVYVTAYDTAAGQLYLRLSVASAACAPARTRAPSACLCFTVAPTASHCVPGSPLCRGHLSLRHRQRFQQQLPLRHGLGQRQCSWLLGCLRRSLTPLAGNPFPAGNQPSAIVVDPTYPFAYVANALDSTVRPTRSATAASSGASAITAPTPPACSRWPSASIRRPTISFSPPTILATTSPALS